MTFDRRSIGAVAGLTICLSSARTLDWDARSPLRDTSEMEFIEGDLLQPLPGELLLTSYTQLQLKPRAIVICVGDSVTFVNHSNMGVNAFSYSAAFKFDTGRNFRPGMSRTVGPFPRAGLVRVYDEIHSHLKGFIQVVDCSAGRDAALRGGVMELRAFREREDRKWLEQEEGRRGAKKPTLWDAIGEEHGAAVAAAHGLRTATFDTIDGQVVVNLPDDAAAGDTLSGTVMVQPRGPDDQKARQRDALGALVLLLPDLKVPVKDAQFTWTVPTMEFGIDATVVQCPVRIVEVTDHREVGMSLMPIDPPVLGGASPTIPPPSAASWPPFGQTGRPAEIIAEFDGRFSTTTVSMPGLTLKLLAESPRKVVFENPTDVIGPATLTMSERGVASRHEYRNIKVALTAPTTNLRSGQHTDVTAEVEGLLGLAEPIPLQLVKSGAVKMDGGDTQIISIKPGEVSQGRFTTTRGITGVRPGGFSVTATVVAKPFDICLQDDKSGTSLLLNSFTGDYRFCTAGSDPPVAGRGQVTKGAAGSSLVEKTNDRRVEIAFSPSVRLATARVRIQQLNRTFLITDADRRNSTCVCGR